jgi:hypothetical protein
VCETPCIYARVCAHPHLHEDHFRASAKVKGITTLGMMYFVCSIHLIHIPACQIPCTGRMACKWNLTIFSPSDYQKAKHAHVASTRRAFMQQSPHLKPEVSCPECRTQDRQSERARNGILVVSRVRQVFALRSFDINTSVDSRQQGLGRELLDEHSTPIVR